MDTRNSRGASEGASPAANLLAQLTSPILLKGDARTAFRDPAVIYEGGLFYLYCSYVLTEEDDKIYWYTILSKSRDLLRWTAPRILTPKDQNLNYSSPGNVIRFGGEWVMCLQAYPIPNYRAGDSPRFGGPLGRVFTMRSQDLENWSEPELLRVKGPNVSREDMGAMIDPYLIEDKDEPGKWWVFFKQRGVSYSWSRDLKNWTFMGHTDCGENVCVLVDSNEYVVFHSPHNGIGVKRSTDLVHWRDIGEPITLGQADWPWAENRLTAGFVLDARRIPGVGKYLMFFHGMGPGKARTTEVINAWCPLGIAWSDDLVRWSWPGKRSGAAE
ncbi:MAG: hypothetical protein NTW86_30260 [Candidatus Sumerlaeota bacterium]|nr:hypothetical protein [Candidatus Sumerlaeota bacterium]